MSNDSNADLLYTYNRLYNFVRNKYTPLKTEIEQNAAQFHQNYDLYSYIVSPNAVNVFSIGRLPSNLIFNNAISTSSTSNPKATSLPNPTGMVGGMTNIQNWRAYDTVDTVSAWKIKLGLLYNDLRQSDSKTVNALKKKNGLQFTVLTFPPKTPYFSTYNKFNALSPLFINSFLTNPDPVNVIRTGLATSMSNFSNAFLDVSGAAYSLKVQITSKSTQAQNLSSNPPSFGCEWFGYFNPSGKSSYMDYTVGTPTTSTYSPTSMPTTVPITSENLFKGEYVFTITCGKAVYFYLWLGDKAICEYTNTNADMSVDKVTFTTVIEDNHFYPLRIQYFSSYSPNNTGNKDNEISVSIVRKSDGKAFSISDCCYVINDGNYVPPLLYCAFVSTSPSTFAEGKFKCYTYDLQKFVKKNIPTSSYNFDQVGASSYAYSDLVDLANFYGLLNQNKFQMQSQGYDTNESGLVIYGQLPDGMFYTPVDDDVNSLPYAFSIYRVSSDIRMGKTFQIKKTPDVLPNGDKVYQIQMINPALLRFANSYTDMVDFYPSDPTNQLAQDVEQCKTTCNENSECGYYYTYTKNDNNYCVIGKEKTPTTFNQIPPITLKDVKSGSGVLHMRNQQMDAAKNCVATITGSPDSTSNPTHTYVDIQGTQDYNKYNNFYWNKQNIDSIQDLGFCSSPQLKKLNNEAKDILLNRREYTTEGDYYCNGKLVSASTSCDEGFTNQTNAVPGDKMTDAIDDTSDVIRNTLLHHNEYASKLKKVNDNYTQLSQTDIPDYYKTRSVLESDVRYDYAGDQLLYFRNKPVPNTQQQNVLDQNEQLVSQNLLYILGMISAATVLVLAVIVGKE